VGRRRVPVPAGQTGFRHLFAFADGSFLVMSDQARAIYRHSAAGVRAGL
jgi:hypothetical protein